MLLLLYMIGLHVLLLVHQSRALCDQATRGRPVTARAAAAIRQANLPGRAGHGAGVQLLAAAKRAQESHQEPSAASVAVEASVERAGTTRTPRAATPGA